MGYTNFIDTLRTSRGMLAEGAVAERLRRRQDVELHPTLFNTPLIYNDHYNDHGRQCLTDIYFEYRTIAKDMALPILLCAPTWRVNEERIDAAGVSKKINQDAVAFMRNLQKNWHIDKAPIFVGGLIGPKNDCYQPQEALSTKEGEQFHLWQVGQLTLGESVDCVVGQTFPAVSEALGAAHACEKFSVPYIISFVTDNHGNVLDGTPLHDAISIIDSKTTVAPVGYMVNCVHPDFILNGNPNRERLSRLIGIMANASSQSHDDLEGATELQQDNLDTWSHQMLALNSSYGVTILGGCCGTDQTHIYHLAKGLSLK